MHIKRVVPAAIAVLLATACRSPSTPSSGTAPDAGDADAGQVGSGSVDADAGQVDSGSVDAGSVSSGQGSAGSSDAGSDDAGPSGVTTLAGNGRSDVDGTGGPHGTAEFDKPNGIAVDAQGVIYVADYGGNSIRRIDLARNVTTLAGNGHAGDTDGTGGVHGTAEFTTPSGVAVDAQGNVYVVDGSNRVRKIDLSGNVTTLAGTGKFGFADGPGDTAEFAFGQGNSCGSVAVDQQDNVYVADCYNKRIRKIDTSGKVTTLAGNGTCAFADGPGATAEFCSPEGIAIDRNGNLYVADTVNGRIRKVDPAGNVTTLAGNGYKGPNNVEAEADGTGGPNGTAEFNWPYGIAVDLAGDVFVSDSYPQHIRKIDAAGNVTSLTFSNGAAVFEGVAGIAVDAAGKVYAAEWSDCIQVMDPSGNITTVAGNGEHSYADGAGGSEGAAEFLNPSGVTVDLQGNAYVADSLNNMIRRIDAAGNVTTIAAFAGEPTGIAVDGKGTVFVVDKYNNRILEVDAAGMVTTLAGNGTNGYADGTGGANGTAEFSFFPAIEWNSMPGLAVDAQGNVLVADAGNNRIRKIDPAGNVTTLAGNGEYGDADGTGGPNGTATFMQPCGVAVDSGGNVYVADTYSNRIRKIDASGNVTTLAGNGLGAGSDGLYSEFYGGYADGTGGPHGTAEFYGPNGLAVDDRGDVFVADSGNNRIRMIDPQGNVTTLTGTGAGGYADGPLSTAEFNNPLSVAVDALGHVYVADAANNRIRLIAPPVPSAP